MSDIRENIATIIQSRACVQSEIARRAGLTPAQFNSVLMKRRKLEANELFRVCAALGMTSEEVAGYGKEMQP